MFERSIYKLTSHKKICFLSSDLNRSKKVSEYISKIISQAYDIYFFNKQVKSSERKVVTASKICINAILTF